MALHRIWPSLCVFISSNVPTRPALPFNLPLSPSLQSVALALFVSHGTAGCGFFSLPPFLFLQTWGIRFFIIPAWAVCICRLALAFSGSLRVLYFLFSSSLLCLPFASNFCLYLRIFLRVSYMYACAYTGHFWLCRTHARDPSGLSSSVRYFAGKLLSVGTCRFATPWNGPGKKQRNKKGSEQDRNDKPFEPDQIGLRIRKYPTKIPLRAAYNANARVVVSVMSCVFISASSRLLVCFSHFLGRTRLQSEENVALPQLGKKLRKHHARLANVARLSKCHGSRDVIEVHREFAAA